MSETSTTTTTITNKWGGDRVFCDTFCFALNTDVSSYSRPAMVSNEAYFSLYYNIINSSLIGELSSEPVYFGNLSVQYSIMQFSGHVSLEILSIAYCTTTTNKHVSATS